jgi:hypothetical protein
MLEHPSRLAAWVYEDYQGIHNTTLSNATLDIGQAPVVPRHVRKFIVSDTNGRILICPISLSPIYWWDCVSIGVPPAAFSVLHLVTYIVKYNDIRHPLTRQNIEEGDLKRIYSMLMYNNRPQLAASLFGMYVRHAEIAFDPEDAIVYEIVASIIMNEMLIHLAWPPMHMSATMQSETFHLILGRYMHHANLSMMSGKVELWYILHTIRRHSLIAATRFDAIHT